MLSKCNGKEVRLIGLYVDECLVVGKEDRIQWLIVEMKMNGFNLKVENNLKDFLISHIIEGR
jgi:hypothetical protein